MAVMNNVSVWWHVAGAVDHRADPALRPGPAPELQLRLHRADQQLRVLRRQHDQRSRSSSRSSRSASCSRSTRSPASTPAPTCPRRPRRPRWARRRASGSRSSTRRSAATSCCSRRVRRPEPPDGAPTTPLGAGGVEPIFINALGPTGPAMVLFISAAGQLFCAVSCMTSASRMTYAFSRDRAVPGLGALVAALGEPGAGQRRHARRRARRDRHAAGPGRGQHRHRGGADLLPVAFYAVTSIAVLGPVPLLRDPDLPALAARREVRGRRLEQRREVQVDEPDRGRRDRHRLLFLMMPAFGRRCRSTTTSSGSSSTTRRSSRSACCS